MSKPLVMKSLECSTFLVIPTLDIVSSQDKFLWEGVMGYSSLLRAGEQVCALNIVIHFQTATKIMVKN